MKTTLLAAFSALALGFGVTAEAQMPCNTGYGWGNSTIYSPTTSYYPTTTSAYSTNYGYVVSQPYGGYITAPQYNSSLYGSGYYGSTWNNTSTYRAPTYTYDPVHGDFHRNASFSTNRWNNGFGHSNPRHRNW
ncbi:hypothetical protein Pan44_45980 [Caulifigura coniformis]|uniref:Uncharacterized protein n=1 Tax=Caulifigura coniformis TaxID=2527983 RepID=A0A517SK93_9PLAN|nr:hypothetical protein [Caulifigura coniformis]QDT56542.1 hypothetical protein Pan44_45980 [Caulifigura coniformis]